MLKARAPIYLAAASVAIAVIAAIALHHSVVIYLSIAVSTLSILGSSLWASGLTRRYCVLVSAVSLGSSILVLAIRGNFA